MEFLFFDRHDNYLFTRDDAEAAVHTEETLVLDAQFPFDAGKPIRRGMRVAFFDEDGAYQAFEIRKPSGNVQDGFVSFDAEHIAVAELTDHIIEERALESTTARLALAAALEGTGWQAGTVPASGQASARYDYVSAWEALRMVQETWGLVPVPRVTAGAGGITGRFIDLLPRRGADRGVRLEADYNIENVYVRWDDTGLATALYGRGKGESGAGSGRKLTFEDVVWSRAAGDPADKPKGRRWVEDVDATAAYGRDGRQRFAVVDFSTIQSPQALLAATWDHLQQVKHPAVSISADVVDLRALGYAGQPIRLGDDVTVIIDPYGIAAQTRVVGLKRDLVEPDRTHPTIGSNVTDMLSISRGIQGDAAAGARVAHVNPSLLDGYIDTVVTRVMSSGTDMDTYADGGLIFTSRNGTAAVLLTGEGILLADTRVGDQWQWRTAIDGRSVNADEIRAGRLHTSLVEIFGSLHFYISGDNMYLVDPKDTRRQIRIGLYDGTRMGIGFTATGGATWSEALTFDGLNATAIMTGVLNANLVRISGDNYMYWDKAYINITNPLRPQELMRFGKYDGTNYGLAFSTDGGGTWQTALTFRGLQFGDEIAGYRINADGFTNGDLIKLMSDGYIKLGGFEIDARSRPYFSFVNGGIEALRIAEGAMTVNHVAYLNGPLYLPNLKSTAEAPNLYWEPSRKEVMYSTWRPDSTGGASLSVTAGNHHPTLGTPVNVTATLSGGTATSYQFTLVRDSVTVDTRTSSGGTYTFTPASAGIYRVDVTATLSAGGTASGSSAPITASTGGGGSTTQMTLVITSQPSAAATVGDLVLWGVQVLQATGTVRGILYRIYGPSGEVLKEGTDYDAASVVVSVPGTYWASFTATDDLGTRTEGGGFITVSPGSTQTPIAGTTTGFDVIIRAQPSVSSGRVTTINAKGARVVITGPSTPDTTGGSIPWWRVSWDSGGNTYVGYIRSDLLEPIYA